MTLCVSWIRTGRPDEGKELLFATDSNLSGGERWPTGLKLFDLGRSDCLLCFAGQTYRAYPLILQGANLHRSSIAWTDPKLDLYDVLNSVCDLFTSVSATINTEGLRGNAPAPMESDDDRADFLFGGWSWRKQQFYVWRISYNLETKSFEPNEEIPKGDINSVSFLGDNCDEARTRLHDATRSSQNFGAYNMEPLLVLARMTGGEFPDIGGPLQVAKVYRSGLHEFFGVKTLSGRYAVLGREINRFDAPALRYIDLQTGEYVETLPPEFRDISAFPFESESKFVNDCYPGDKLRTDLSEIERYRLQRIFHNVAYNEFVLQRERTAVEISVTASPEELTAISVQDSVKDLDPAYNEATTAEIDELIEASQNESQSNE